jgi:hypothetical protein
MNLGNRRIGQEIRESPVIFPDVRELRESNPVRSRPDARYDLDLEPPLGRSVPITSDHVLVAGLLAALRIARPWRIKAQMNAGAYP